MCMMVFSLKQQEAKFTYENASSLTYRKAAVQQRRMQTLACGWLFDKLTSDFMLPSQRSIFSLLLLSPLVSLDIKHQRPAGQVSVPTVCLFYSLRSRFVWVPHLKVSSPLCFILQTLAESSVHTKAIHASLSSFIIWWRQEFSLQLCQVLCEDTPLCVCV